MQSRSTSGSFTPSLGMLELKIVCTSGGDYSEIVKL